VPPAMACPSACRRLPRYACSPARAASTDSSMTARSAALACSRLFAQFIARPVMSRRAICGGWAHQDQMHSRQRGLLAGSRCARREACRIGALSFLVMGVPVNASTAHRASDNHTGCAPGSGKRRALHIARGGQRSSGTSSSVRSAARRRARSSYQPVTQLRRSAILRSSSPYSAKSSSAKTLTPARWS
jgi:hypothetical protein